MKRLMARKSRSKKRIEPRISNESEKDIRVSRSERVGAVPKTPKPASKSAKKTKSRKGAKKPFWLWRFVRWIFRPAPRLFYWGLVFSLWGGIIIAGIVGYYAAQLPSAEDWVIPERPPNMRIVAVDKSLGILNN